MKESSAKYLLKDEKAKELRGKVRNSYIAKATGISDTFVSLILNQKIKTTKTTAYAFTKALDSRYEVEDLFEVK